MHPTTRVPSVTFESGSKYQFRVKFCEQDETNNEILREFRQISQVSRSNVSPDLERLGQNKVELLLDEVTDENHRVFQELFGQFKPKQVISEAFYPFLYSMRFGEHSFVTWAAFSIIEADSSRTLEC